MSPKLIIFTAVCLTIIIILEPWLLLVLEPIVIYLFNILACLVFLIGILLLSKNLESEGSGREIVSLTAHQLSSPLSDVKWSLEMLLNDDFGKLSEEQRAVLTKASKKNDQLIYLVNDLLDASKIDCGMYPLDLERCNMEDIVLSVSDFYKDEIEKKKIKFKFIKPQNGLSEIIMDGQKMKLAIQNLFDNAIRYTPAGGEITASLKTRGKHIQFKIQDSGIGIKKNQTAKIFNKFFRGSNASKQDPVGNGLGLFFVRKIVGAHGGKIWFDSTEGQGSTFYFTLPIK